MKVLQFIPNLNTGGAEIMMENLSRQLANMDIELKVICFYQGETHISRRLGEKKIEIVYLDKKMGFDFSILRKIRKIVLDFKPDVLHTHLNVLPYVFLATRKTKIVHTIHSIASKEQVGFEKKICKFIYKSNRCVPVAISPMVKESMFLEYKLNQKIIPMIYNGVDLANYKKKENYALKEQIIITHVGSLIELKNHTLMIDALELLKAKHKNIKMKFLGVGVDEKKLKQYVKFKKLEDEIEFVGLVDNVEKYLSETDIFILPSKYEGMPMSIIEAMATGLPIVASNVGGIPDMIESGKEGILIEPFAINLAMELEKLLQSEKIRNQLGNAAYEKSFEYSVIKMAERYVEVYKV